MGMRSLFTGYRSRVVLKMVLNICVSSKQVCTLIDCGCGCEYPATLKVGVSPMNTFTGYNIIHTVLCACIDCSIYSLALFTVIVCALHTSGKSFVCMCV